MLLGEYNHNIDEKGRMNFPAKMRDELGSHFVITLWSDDCLAVFPDAEWTRISEKIRQLPMAQATKVQRYIFPNACDAEPDKQGRILIPQNLRDKAKLSKDVTVIGVMDRAEIWDTERWNKKNETADSATFEELLEEYNF